MFFFGVFSFLCLLRKLVGIRPTDHYLSPLCEYYYVHLNKATTKTPVWNIWQCLVQVLVELHGH